MQLKPGTALKGGEFIIEKVLGQGGFGITYLAVQAGLNRKVAVKEFFMKEHCNRDNDTAQVSVPSLGSRDQVARFKAKFVKEAQTIAQLNHPNIIRIISVFEENGTAYYVMDYIDGGSLEQLSTPESPMPVSAAKKYIGQLAGALGYLHSNNILHLDVKPSNVLVNNGNAVLIDFGISKRYDSEDGGQTSTSPVGISEGYAPLEQYNKDGVSHFTPAADVYSLGATLYMLVTGRKPLSASELVTLQEGLNIPAGLPVEISGAIRAAMCPMIWMRPQSVEAFMDIVEGRVQVSKPATSNESDGATRIFTENSSVPPTPPLPPAPLKNAKPKKKRKWGKWILIISIVAIVGAGAWWGINKYKESKPERSMKEQVDLYLKSLMTSVRNGEDDRAVDWVLEIDSYYEALDVDEKEKCDQYLEDWWTSHPEDSELFSQWWNEVVEDDSTENDEYSEYDDYSGNDEYSGYNESDFINKLAGEIAGYLL
jgi:serine/threonine protein kinase